MPKRLGKFELPSKLTKVEEGATPTYAKFIAEPFEAGYGHTVGNSLRRVLLSSIEGAAISSIKIDGVLWMKASGKWMADATREDILIPLDWLEITGDCLQKNVNPAERYPGASVETGASHSPTSQ